jgi:PIN domain nuclease of toxin-antitoxin system
MLLLDTHAFIWLASDLRKLTDVAKATIQAHAGQLLLSGISGLEIALPVKRGRLKLPVDPNTFIMRALNQHNIKQIPVTTEIGCRAADLPDIHNDPFDRIIISTAQIHHASILSKDGTISFYPDTKTVWK